MKKKSPSQSAFFNLRLLIGLAMAMIGVLLALSGFGVFSAQAQLPAAKANSNPLVPYLFDCARIPEMGIDVQENLRAGAIMIYCGQALGGEPLPDKNVSPLMKLLLGPLAFGTADVDLITGTETSPKITQSETFTAANPDNPNEIIVAYNDSRSQSVSNISGASVSTDGGNTFTRLTLPSGHSPFAATFGDPVVLYNRPTATWYTVWLDGACGSQGLGGYKSTTPTNPASWSHFCIHTGSGDDRESGWVDNNPASPFYGRMYISWNDFSLANDNIMVSRSTDNGLTWSAGVQVSSTFIRNVQITGDMGGSGAVYIAGMNEMGGGLGNRANRIYRSTDGGVTWTDTYTGPTFPGPGRGASGFFACMYNSPAYWRHQGWGQPAALNGVVHYVYSARDTGTGDPGNVFYIRSTDNGVTFSAPFMLNTNTDATKAQWQPNLSVTASGSLMSVWYDERERVGASCQPSGNPCYRMWARKSNDNGATWLADDTFSDVVTPLPLQSDPGIQATYAGDYDYASPVLNQHLHAWTDGRVLIGGNSQQDAFFDREPLSAGLVVATTVPAVGSVVFSPPTSFTVNVTNPVQAGTLQAGDFTVNGIPANSVSYTPATTTMTFGFSSSPVTTQGLQTMNIAGGAFLRDPDGNPVLAFTGAFRYDTLQLQVTSTNPPFPGGIFNLPGPFTYDVNFNEPVSPASVQTGDLLLSGVSGTAVTGVTPLPGNTTARFTINMTAPGTLTASIAAGNITDAFGNPNAAFSAQYQVSSGGCILQQVFAQNFDGVTPPTLPAGWVATNALGAAPLWVTSNAGLPTPVADTAPNAAFVGDPATTADKRLDSPSIAIQSTFASLSFRHNYSFETSWDGGVLEISIGGGVFSDVIAAGGSFVTGGYNATLNSSANPLQGRQAWNGSSGGFITSTINLPAAAAGQNIALRWRMGSDASVSAQGWRVDTITLSDCLVGPTPTPGPTATPTPTPTASPTPTPSPTPSPTPTPTPTPALVSISGTVVYCSNPALNPVPAVTMTLTGPSPAPSSTPTNGSGTYTLSGLTTGASYTVTPTKTALTPGNAAINTIDVVAAQRHFLVLGTPLSGCRLTGADVSGDAAVNTVDVIAIQRFFLALTTGTANTGKYQFSPVSRSYPAIGSNQTGQNYDSLVFGDVAATFAHRPEGGPGQDATSDDSMSAAEVPSSVAAVTLPKVTVDQSKATFTATVTTSAIDEKSKLVGFQGDFTFDERVVSFGSEPVQKAGITGANWNVSGNVLPGAGPIRTLRISAFSNDFKPLSGSGTLFELKIAGVNKTAQSTQLVWAAAPDQFIFIDADLHTQTPGNTAPGSVTLSGKRD